MSHRGQRSRWLLVDTIQPVAGGLSVLIIPFEDRPGRISGCYLPPGDVLEQRPYIDRRFIHCTAVHVAPGNPVGRAWGRARLPKGRT